MTINWCDSCYGNETSPKANLTSFDQSSKILWRNVCCLLYNLGETYAVYYITYKGETYAVYYIICSMSGKIQA